MSRDCTTDSGPNSPKTRAAHPFRFFVCGFPSSTTEDELRKYFSTVHPILDVKIIRDVADGSSKGYGFVTTVTKEDTTAFLNSTEKLEFKGRGLSTGPAFRRFDNGPLEYLVATPHGVFPSQSIATKHQFMASTGLCVEAASACGNFSRGNDQAKDQGSVTKTAKKSPNTDSQTEFPAISGSDPAHINPVSSGGTVNQCGKKQTRAEPADSSVGFPLSSSHHQIVDRGGHHNPMPLMSFVAPPCNSSLPNMNHYIAAVPSPLIAYSFFATPNGNIPVVTYPPHTIVSPIAPVQFAFPPPNISEVGEHADLSDNGQMGNVHSHPATAVTSFDSGISDVSNYRGNSLRSHQNNYQTNQHHQNVSKEVNEEKGRKPLTYSQAVRSTDSNTYNRNGKHRERKNTASSGNNRRENSGRVYPPVRLEMRQRREDGHYVEPGVQQSDNEKKGSGSLKSDGKNKSNTSSTGSVCNRISRLDLKDDVDKKTTLDKNVNLANA